MTAPLSRRTFLTALAAGALAPRVSAAEAPDTRALVSGNTAFGCDLYGALRGEAGNLFLSPFSVSTALAMTAAGARGATFAEMEKVLHLPKAAPAAFGAVLKSVNGTETDPKKRGFELSTANALWAQKGYPWRAEYKAAVATDFGAGLFDVDYKSDPETARGAINAWVEKETREKIKDLLPKGTVTGLTRLVLTNAIYFKGDWADPFKKEHTKAAPFLLANGTKAEAQLMFRSGGFDYAETETYQALELPYAGKRLGMVVVVPRKPDGLPAVEKGLTGEALAALVKGLRRERTVRVYLPRFKVEKVLTLNEPLQQLGMKAAFARADFGGMHTGGEDLNISAVVHKAFVDVNEKGTEAAAATGVVVGLASAPVQPKEVRADRPFLFLIRDRETGSVLFMGRLSEPTK